MRMILKKKIRKIDYHLYAMWKENSHKNYNAWGPIKQLGGNHPTFGYTIYGHKKSTCLHGYPQNILLVICVCVCVRERERENWTRENIEGNSMLDWEEWKAQDSVIKQ